MIFPNDPHIDTIARAFVLAVMALVWVVILIRINGLRSLSKMTNFDFVMTVALGSLLAGAAQATQWSGFLQALVAMIGLFFAQWSAAKLRKASDLFETAIQNEPVLLMRNGVINEKAMKETRVARSDLIAKLREANVLEIAKVRAVVLEATGDISVLHGDVLDETLLEQVETD